MKRKRSPDHLKRERHCMLFAIPLAIFIVVHHELFPAMINFISTRARSQLLNDSRDDCTFIFPWGWPCTQIQLENEVIFKISSNYYCNFSHFNDFYWNFPVQQASQKAEIKRITLCSTLCWHPGWLFTRREVYMKDKVKFKWRYDVTTRTGVSEIPFQNAS